MMMTKTTAMMMMMGFLLLQTVETRLRSPLCSLGACLRSRVPIEPVCKLDQDSIKRCIINVPPDSCAHVTTTSSKDASGRAGCDGDD